MDELESLKDERRYWLSLSVCNGIGPTRFHMLLRHFGSAKKAWFADRKELLASGIGQKLSEELVAFRETFSIDKYEEQMYTMKISYLTLQDSGYPHLLKLIKRPPMVLFQKGTFIFNKNEILVSVVGTRKITEYGREVTELLVSDLVAAGCIIVSGLAMGVDAVAAHAAILAGGTTIAVLGSGVDMCTPRENVQLYNSILEHGGCIVSETPLGMMPMKGSFPARNRIIAGLSSGVLVTEGAADSGSLITANDAFENNRKVFAVPGPITSSVSKGPISLIAKGAKMVLSAQDIIDELGINNQESRRLDKKQFTGLTKEEKKVCDVLQDQNLHFDEIVRKTGFASAALGTTLSLMEVKGLLVSGVGGFFRLK
jgi:DNA processing protein